MDFSILTLVNNHCIYSNGQEMEEGSSRTSPETRVLSFAALNFTSLRSLDLHAFEKKEMGNGNKESVSYVRDGGWRLERQLTFV